MKSGKAALVEEQLRNYLLNGEILIPMLHWVNDLKDNRPFGPHIIRTDGIWLWPDYLVHYLEKGYLIEIPKDFKENAIASKYIIPIIETARKKKIAEFYLAKTKTRIPKW